MKKIVSILLVLILLTGCDAIMATPTQEVEKFLGKYQTMDKEVLSQLDDVIKTDITMNENQKEMYKEVMKKQYQNLSYKIKDETIDGDHASIETEIEVYDYNKSMKEADSYLASHGEEFVKEDGTTDEEKFMEYKINKIKKSNDKVTYTITFTLTKKDDKWTLDDITDIERQKIHGIYEY